MARDYGLSSYEPPSIRFRLFAGEGARATIFLRGYVRGRTRVIVVIRGSGINPPIISAHTCWQVARELVDTVLILLNN